MNRQDLNRPEYDGIQQISPKNYDCADPSDIENTQRDEIVESGLGGGQKPCDIGISIEKGPSAIENIQRDEVVESGLGGGQEPGGIEISIKNGNLSILQMQRRIKAFAGELQNLPVSLVSKVNLLPELLFYDGKKWAILNGV